MPPFRVSLAMIAQNVPANDEGALPVGTFVSWLDVSAAVQETGVIDKEHLLRSYYTSPMHVVGRMAIGGELRV